MLAAAHVAPTPGEPAAPLLTGGGAAGLTVVEAEHWSKRLQVTSCGVDDRYVLAAPLAGTAVGLFVHFELWAQLTYLAPGSLIAVIVSSLAVERVRKMEKRQRRAAMG